MNGVDKEKRLCCHCVQNAPTREKFIVFNHNSDKVDDDFLINVHFKNQGYDIPDDVYAEIAKYLLKILKNKEKSMIIIPKAGDITVLNREMRRKLKINEFIHREKN